MSETETTTIGSDKLILKTARTEQSLPEQNYYDIMQVYFAVCIGELGEASVLDWCAVGRELGEVRAWVAMALVHRGRCQQAQEGDGATWLEGCSPPREVSTGRDCGQL